MASYKDPSFQDRTALAQQAREKALKLLAAKKAPVDEAEVARRKAAREAKEAAEAEKRAAKKAAIEQAKAEKKAAAMVPEVAKPTEEELKAARDAKYAARKNRKK
ncbi:DUF6481 family protein [Novosphingobium sp.]|uniref:DUF6481 family protein n=1 Tax=Novosphingobium sp. TaxID=1874826 RepID=UPI00286D742F|nr:DUF6481 family protein [Novosphingobium sp.]